MKIRLSKNHASLSPFPEVTIPDFTIITGTNGSGKTHLLQAIQSGLVEQIDNSKIIKEWHPIQEAVLFSDVGLLTLETRDFGMFDRPRFYDVVGYRSNFVYPFVHFIVTNDLIETARDTTRTDILSSSNEYVSALHQLSDFDFGSGATLEHESKLIQLYLTDDTIEFVKNKLTSQDDIGRKEAAELERRMLTPDPMFLQSLSFTFNNYLTKRLENHYAYFSKNQLGAQNDSISDSEFVARFPEPWELANRMLSDLGLDLQFESYKITDYSTFRQQGIQIELRIIRPSFGAQITIHALSSGENVALGLVSKLFLNGFYQQNLKAPDCLLLDEPDAHLHPELTNKVLSVLNEIFVRRFGMKVIMTTHSPTTVALAPEGSVFKISNGPDTKLEPVSKDEALSMLTSFLPTLSIDYKNHRQVFVESPTDQNYYTTLHELLVGSEGPDLTHQLYFIASAKGKGNTDQVKKVVAALRDAGNGTSFGVIDRDDKNRSFVDPYILVHGEEERYSIESFLFDPIYIVAYLISCRDGEILKRFELKNFPEQRIGELSNDQLQAFVDYFFEKVGQAMPKYAKLESFRTVKYLNDRSLNIPTTYLEENGHKGLAPLLTKTFPNHFTKIHPDSMEFKDAMISLIAKCYPFAPMVSIDLIRDLCNTQYK